MVDGTNNRCAEQWTNADLFFLTDAVACGMPFADIAGFLNCAESEVRARWRLVADRCRPSAARAAGAPPNDAGHQEFMTITVCVPNSGSERDDREYGIARAKEFAKGFSKCVRFPVSSL